MTASAADASVCFSLQPVTNDADKCTKHQFIHLLRATLKNSHIENSKKSQKVILFSSTLTHSQFCTFIYAVLLLKYCFPTGDQLEKILHLRYFLQ